VLTLVDRTNYTGIFLPGYQKCTFTEPLNKLFPESTCICVDHLVHNYGEGDMIPTVEYFVKMLDFHRYWSVDDKEIHTEYSSLKSIVVSDFDERVKMPVNEPAEGRKVSQIQEFVE